MPSRRWRAAGNPLLPRRYLPDVVSAAATWNPANSSTDWTFTNGNLTAERTSTAASFWAALRATTAKASGTFAVTVNALDGGAFPAYIGLDTGGETQNLGHDANGDSIGYETTGSIIYAGSSIFTGLATFAPGDVIKVVKAGASVSFYKNNVLVQTVDTASAVYGSLTLLTGAAFPAAANGNGTGTKLTIDTSLW